MELVLTNQQRLKIDRDQQIVAAFGQLRHDNPDASAAAIIRTLVASGRFKLTKPGIARVLYATGTLPEKRS